SEPGDRCRRTIEEVTTATLECPLPRPQHTLTVVQNCAQVAHRFRDGRVIKLRNIAVPQLANERLECLESLPHRHDSSLSNKRSYVKPYLLPNFTQARQFSLPGPFPSLLLTFIWMPD